MAIRVEDARQDVDIIQREVHRQRPVGSGGEDTYFAFSGVYSTGGDRYDHITCVCQVSVAVPSDCWVDSVEG